MTNPKEVEDASGEGLVSARERASTSDVASAHSGKEQKTPEHRIWHGTHLRWTYTPRAFRWNADDIVGVNFLPLASEFRAWLGGSGHLRWVPGDGPEVAGRFTNPYALSAASLVLVLSQVVNAFHIFVTTETQHDSKEAELERIRLYNEIVLCVARVCEALVKQLLYCTSFNEERYRRKALGALLESPCPACAKSKGSEPHFVSLVGSLAHPFKLCMEFEHCAMDHMNFVNRIRNSQAAHSNIQIPSDVSPPEAKARLLADGDAVLEGFVHMLSHLEKLERAMLFDLTEKALEIRHLAISGVAPEDRNFVLVPGEEFKYDPPKGVA